MPRRPLGGRLPSGLPARRATGSTVTLYLVIMRAAWLMVISGVTVSTGVLMISPAMALGLI